MSSCTCFAILFDSSNFALLSIKADALAVARDDVIATAAIPRAVLDTLELPEGCIALAAAATAAIAPLLGFFASAANNLSRSLS